MRAASIFFFSMLITAGVSISVVFGVRTKLEEEVGVEIMSIEKIYHSVIDFFWFLRGRWAIGHAVI